jgi:hypothetical protein
MMVREQVFEFLFSKTTLTPLILDRSEEHPFAKKTLNLLQKYVFTYFITLDYKPVLYAAECWWCSCNFFVVFSTIILCSERGLLHILPPDAGFPFGY